MVDVDHICVALLLSLSVFLPVSDASPGDADPVYRVCIELCEKTGCVKEKCFPACEFSSSALTSNGSWFMHEPLYLQWKQWDCLSDCRYHCMIDRETERGLVGGAPIKYHGKWPFTRVFGVQEPVSVAFSVLNLAMHFHGWLSFIILLWYKLPQKLDKTTYYEYTTLWHIYALLSMNSWIWSSVFHSRDVELTEKLDYSSTVALLGFSLLLSIIRSLNIRIEAARVMIAAPLLAFVGAHISYINFYHMNYGWNMKVCVTMAVLQLLIWAVWAGVSNHPSKWKLWTVIIGGGLAMLLEIYDFPPYKGYLDAHALWHATTVPLTCMWWSFIRNDAEYRTSQLRKKAK
ncbi:unnamed protein product [Rhodiola kirilowii]